MFKKLLLVVSALLATGSVLTLDKANTPVPEKAFTNNENSFGAYLKSVNGVQQVYSPAHYYMEMYVEFETNFNYINDINDIALIFDLSSSSVSQDMFILLDKVSFYTDTYGNSGGNFQGVSYVQKLDNLSQLAILPIPNDIRSFLSNQTLYLTLVFTTERMFPDTYNEWPNPHPITEYISTSFPVAQAFAINPLYLYSISNFEGLAEEIGFNNGVTQGNEDYYDAGYNDGLEDGYDIGFADAETVADGSWLGSLVFGTVGGIVGFLFALSDFEVLGVSIMSIITLFVAIGIIKLLIKVIK